PACSRRCSRCFSSSPAHRRTPPRTTSRCCRSESRSAARCSSCASPASRSDNDSHFDSNEETMKTITMLLTILLMTALSPLARAASADTPAGTTIDAEERRGDAESDLYGQGTDAIDEEEWTRAIDLFKRVVAMKGKRTDGALYWLAYAQTKAGRGAEALQTIDALERSHPKSRWIRDAKALEIDIKQASGQKIDPAKVDDEEVKLIAIQGLLSTNPERALPLLQKLVDGPYSRRVKEQALFVLSQSSSDRAAQLIASIARGSTHLELQSDAIKYLGISGQRN